MEEPLRQSFHVSGLVQGVGYRWWARREARALGLSGFVRNAPDGGVEVEAAGSADGLRRLRVLLATGPPGAAVTRVEERPAASGVLPHPFDIVR